MSKLEDALWDADTAFKRLNAREGTVARRNGRNAMLKALLKARKALDEEFPLERRAPRRRKNKDQLAGFSEISGFQLDALLRAGVRRTQFKKSPRPSDVRAAQRLAKKNNEKPKLKRDLVSVHWAPNWMVRALDAKVDIRTIVKAVRSQPTRKGIETVIRLGFKKTGS